MGSQRCRLVVVGRDGLEKALSPDPALLRTLVLMQRIDAYAQGLAAIVAAETATDIAAHVDTTLANVDYLAETVASLDPDRARPPVDTTAYATAADGLVDWAAGQYVQHRKLRALRRATADSKAVIDAAAGLFTRAAEIAAVVPRRPMAEIVTQRIDAFDDAPTPDNLDRLIESAAAYDRLLAASPPMIFQRLTAAHTALVDNLHGDDVSLVVVIARIRRSTTMPRVSRPCCASWQRPATGL